MINMCHIGFITFGLSLGFGSAAASAEVVAVVAAKNPVSSLTKSQIADMFLGKMTRFPDGREVLPIDHVENSSERDEFYLSFTGKSPAQIKAFWSKIIFTGQGQPPREASNGVEVKKFIAKHPDAIGYIEQKLVDDSVKVVLTK
ncbi:MAG: phosphate ABC transporter substrate-binding protein [Burkholderiales bacterium]|nr:phosphate ABC transporter substrate-binding protein [Burkholderiales bacterium]